MRTYARIDRRILQENYQTIQRAVGPDVVVLAVVKADAYGHGAVEVARALSQAGASRFAVAYLGEGVSLREAGIVGDIVVLGGAEAGEEPCFRAQRLTPFIHTPQQLCAWERESAASAERLGCHLEIDSGMNRLGLPADPALLADWIGAAPHLRIEGLATHLASAEDFRDAQAEWQRQRFLAVAAALRERGIECGRQHLSNSAAIAYRPDWTAGIVRPGLALYGYLSPALGPAPPARIEVRPALEWNSRILAVREAAAGARLGYQGAFTAKGPMRLAVVSAGYGDGLSRRMSNGGMVLVRGRRCPIVGLISMEVTLVDVTGLDGIEAGEEVSLIGPGLDAWEMAGQCGSIAYETLCGISSRVPRVYV
jgi:alanine racemase